MIERKIEDLNTILEQVKIRKISVEDKINMEERNNILELLKRPWSWKGWALKDASEDVIALLHIDLILNTNLTYLHLLRDVIEVLHISLYHNSTTGGYSLDDERELGEEICRQPCSCKQGGDVFQSRLSAPLLEIHDSTVNPFPHTASFF